MNVPIFALAFAVNNSAITVPESSTEFATFLDSVAADAGYLAIRDDGGSAGGDGGGVGDHDFGQTDGLSPRDKTSASSA